MNLKKIAEIITLILLVFATLTLSVLLYARFLYPDADYEQITITVEHLTPKVIFAALSLKDYILALLFFIFIYPICYFLLNKKQQLIALLFMSSLSLYLTGYPTHFILSQTKTTLYEQHYITPKTLQLTFPKQKKNLVLIYLESFEQNFTEEKYYQKNLIPNLQKLQQKGQFVTNYSNLPGATFSVAAIVASQCGIPIRPRAQKNDLYTKSHFLPQAVCFPELLRQNGYQTAIIKAADITYTDVDIFAKSHGYEKAIGFEEIVQTYPEDELESHLGTFDGINDKSLFEYAKKQLAAFNPDKPFMLTLFSLDTHGPNFFKDPSCPVVFNDERDAFLCTDKIVADFISWFKTTPYYKNTTIVILGDHLMPYALNNKTPKKRGTYNAFLNLDNSLKLDTTKTYSTYDFAPTILESLNIKLDNRAFGLGRSLFAKEPTLVEQLSFAYLKNALRQKSDTYERFQTPPQERSGAYLPYQPGTVLNATEVLTYADVYKKVLTRNYLDTITLTLPKHPQNGLQLKIKFNAVLNHKHSVTVSANDVVIGRVKGTKYPKFPFELTADIPESALKDNKLKLIFRNDSGTYYVTHMGISLEELVITEK